MADIPSRSGQTANTALNASRAPFRSERSISLPTLEDGQFLGANSVKDQHLAQNQSSPPFLPPCKPYFRPGGQSLSVGTPPSDTNSNPKTQATQDDVRGDGFRKPSRTARVDLANSDSLHMASGGFQGRELDNPCIQRHLPNHIRASESTGGTEPWRNAFVLSNTRPLIYSASKRSLLRFESRPSLDDEVLDRVAPEALTASHSDTFLISDKTRMATCPYAQAASDPEAGRSYANAVNLTALPAFTDEQAWWLPPLPLSRTSSQSSEGLSATKLKSTLSRWSSLDNILAYQEQKAEWKRSSSILQQEYSPSVDDDILELAQTFEELSGVRSVDEYVAKVTTEAANARTSFAGQNMPISIGEESKFRHFSAEVGFCFTIAMTQFLTEYLISGFAIELSRLPSSSSSKGDGSQSMGMFWPASLLSLILSASLLVFARLSDMYGGYPFFIFGVVWLAIWTLIPGFSTSLIMLDVARAMQGLAIAAFVPSTFVMVGSIYSEGPRRNFVMGLYSGCAPLGFFGGLFIASVLTKEKSEWYFLIASAVSLLTVVTAFLTVPSDRTDRAKLGLKMDWVGSSLIPSGLILVSYALSVEPYANKFQPSKSGFEFPIVIGPLSSGLVLLAVAFCYEGWRAKCPLLPFEFFKPKGVKALCFAGLCFYATYGVWLYNSAEFFQNPVVATNSNGRGVSGISLALWYIPTAIGGIILCVVGGALIHRVPIMTLLLISALAWIAAPLLLAVAPLPVSYWKYVFASMLCATIGIDLTFTISIVFISSVQPLRYQGLTGAICSILVNLAMSFGLCVSEIVTKKAKSTIHIPKVVDSASTVALSKASIWGFRAAFLYGAASAGLGLVTCVFFVRISRSVLRKQPVNEERLRFPPSASTLVSNRELHEVNEDEQDNPRLLEQQPEIRRGEG